MKITPDLLAWQRRLYAENHANRFNLVLHLFTAPLFMLGVVGLVTALFTGSGTWALWGAGGVLTSFVAQGIGHARELVAPQPFRSPLDFAARFVAENGFTFWRFVFSGEYLKNLRAK